VKNGTGTLQLSGANTYAGGTLINTGTVVAVNSSGSALGSGGLLIAGGSTLQLGTNSTVGSLAPQPGGLITNHGTLTFNRRDTVTVSNVMTGAGAVRQNGSGILIFNQDHSYTNTTTVLNNHGVLRITAPSALGTLDGGTIVNGGNTPPPGAGGHLEMAGGVVFAPERLTLGCRGTNVFLWNAPSQFVNQSGTNTWTGPIDITQGGSYIALQSDGGLMRIEGSIAGGPIATGTRMLVLRGVADGEVSGVISNGPVTTALSVCKGDSGAWTLSAINTYGGATTISNGTLLINGLVAGSTVNTIGGVLGGTGTITAPVVIEAAGTLAPGQTVGALTISNTLTLNGTTRMELSKAGGLVTHDAVRGLSGVTYGGTLEVTLTGDPTGGEVFRLFEAASYSGAFATAQLPALPSGLSWNTESLAVDGTLRIDGSVPQSPEFVGIRISGSQVIVGGTGGVAGGTYYVLSSTNLTLPPPQWTRRATNAFGPGGVFLFTNAVSPSIPQEFYLLQLP
jgi:autotransporter-associated beta strand protein